MGELRRWVRIEKRRVNLEPLKIKGTFLEFKKTRGQSRPLPLYLGLRVLLLNLFFYEIARKKGEKSLVFKVLLVKIRTKCS